MQTLEKKVGAEGMTRCPFCGGPSHLHVSASDFHLRTTSDTFQKLKCDECGLVFMQDPPDDVGEYYPTTYRFRPDNLSKLDAFAIAEEYKIDLIHKFKSSGELLEIGSSNGAFALVAKRAGFEVTSIEMDEECVNFMRKEIGISAICSQDPVHVLSKSQHEYDVICLWHTLEHLREPWKFLEVAVKRLKTGGILVIAVPNPDSLQARILKGKWLHYDIPRHFYDMSPSWMRRVLTKMGLTESLCTYSDRGSRFYTRLTWIALFKTMVGEGDDDRRNLKRLGSILGRLVNPIEVYTKNSAAYTIVFSKTTGV